MNHQSKTTTRPGKTLILFAVLLPALLGMVGLVIDGGLMMSARRQAQNAADAAALAAAMDRFTGKSDSTARSTATTFAIAHHELPNAQLVINIPPQTGPYQANTRYVEAIVTNPVNTWFIHMVGAGRQQTVQARAVAGERNLPIPRGLILLQPTGSSAFHVSGNANMDIVNGSIYVNSSDASAFHKSGNGIVTAESHEIVGGVQQSGNGGISGAIHTGVEPILDPLRLLPPPNPADYPVRSTQHLSINQDTAFTLEPGVYRGGISLSGKGAVTLQPGIYIMDGGGFSITGKGSVTGQGVMIYNAGITQSGGAFHVSGQGQIILTPPTSGLYEGVTLFQDRSLNQTVHITGNGQVTITGILYAAAAQVHLTGNGSTGLDTLGGSIVASTMHVSGNGSLKVDFGAGRPTTPLVTLVE